MPLSAAVVAGIGAATATLGSAISIAEQRKQTKITQRTSIAQRAASQRAENARKRAAALRRSREERAALRERIIAGARSRATAITQLGTLEGSVPSGAQSEIFQSGAFNLTQLGQGFEIGQDIFGANQAFSDAGTEGAIATASSQSREAIGTGLSSTGKNIFANSQDIAKISESLFS